jgi:RNA polymerase sigma factor (sigma-70 family)
VSEGPARGSSVAAADEADQFRRLMLPHLDGAYNLACYLTRDPMLSEDIVQDSFVRAFRGFGQFRGGSPRAWLFAIVRNCCRTAHTSRAGALALITPESSLTDGPASTIDDHPDPSPTPEEGAIHQGEIDRLRQAIEAMPEPFREAVVLRDIEDLSYAEIALSTGVPIGTVMSRLSRGRSILAKALLPSAENEDEESRSAS